LSELMLLVKNTGDVLNLTTTNEVELDAQEVAQNEDAQIKSTLEESHETGLNHDMEPENKPTVNEQPKEQITIEESTPSIDEIVVKEPEIIEEEPKVSDCPPIEEPQYPNMLGEKMTKKEWYNIPPYLRQKMRPAKAKPNFKPQVHWLHGKLRLDADHDSNSGVNAAGAQLRNAVLAQQGPIEINAGPINGKISLSQYNTPLNMYSDPQIIKSLMSQAIASGADIQDPQFFMNTGVKVDTDSGAYKQVNSDAMGHDYSKQSKSFNILTTLLKHPYPDAGH